MSERAVDAATTGSSNGAKTVSKVVPTELRMRSSLPAQAASARAASVSPHVSRILSGSPSSSLSVQRTTYPIPSPARSAASRRGASCFAAAVYQKAASAIPLRPGVDSTSQPAILCASDQPSQPERGDHDETAATPDPPVGSNTEHGPSVERQARV